MKRWVATAAMVLALLGVAMAPAHADPINAPFVEPFDITCEDGATYTVVVVPGARPGPVDWPPALVTTSNQVLIPFSFQFTLTNLTTGEVVMEEEISREPADRAATTTCTFGETFTEDGVTFEFVGVVEELSQPLS
jgi:hypothetical protein